MFDLCHNLVKRSVSKILNNLQTPLANKPKPGAKLGVQRSEINGSCGNDLQACVTPLIYDKCSTECSCFYKLKPAIFGLS